MKNTAALALALLGGLFNFSFSGHSAVNEDFATDPVSRGWQTWGESSLFEWEASAGTLTVTWDSAKPNSFYALPLGSVLTRSNDFSATLDLSLGSFVAGLNPSKPYPFQLAFGFLSKAEATAPGFLRGTGFSSPDLVEFSFFPDPGGSWVYGPSITASMIDSSGTNWSSGGFGPFGLEVNQVYHVQMVYSSSAQTLTLSVTLNGEPVGEVTKATLGAAFQDFAVDHFAICSYSDEGQYPEYAGSLLAHGIVDNLQLTLPESPVGLIRLQHSATNTEVSLQSQPGWLYTLECSADLSQWTIASNSKEGTGGSISLVDTNAPASCRFYRVSGRLR